MNAELVEGALVKWSGGQGLGYIKRISQGRIEVRWDSPSEITPTLFKAKDAPLVRAMLPAQVRRVSTDQPGFLGQLASADPPRWRVTLLGHKTFVEKVVPESDLRPDDTLDPAERMRNGEVGSARQFLLQLATRFLRQEHLQNDLVSLGDARVDIKPHQVGVVHRVITNYPHRFLLCDEVGLGKTIEAGMILKELRARKQATRALVIVPPNLVRQWQFELKTKFNEVFSVLNTATVQFLRTQGHDTNPFAYYDSVLVSADWVSNKKWAELVVEVEWDMLIVDEAHHARLRRWGSRTQTTQLYNLVRQLAAPAHFANRALLFLTATPMQLEADELYSLVELVDPALFPTEKHFERHREQSPGLNRLVEALQKSGFPPPGEDAAEVISQVAAWLSIDQELAKKRLQNGRSEVSTLCQELSNRHLLSEVLIRNRKSVVGGFMPRKATRWEVNLRPDEREALDAVEDYVLNGFNLADRTKDNAVGFVMVIFQKLMASSIRALRESLAGRRERVLKKAMQSGASAADLEALVEDDVDLTAVLGATGAAYATEAIELDGLVELLDRIKVDSKAEALLSNLEVIFDHDQEGKVLIFTEFRETQRYLAERISARGWEVNVFHGQQKAEDKDLSVERFRDGKGHQVLICTEAGGEGRNFQFCHMLVNYDLPWNPMRVEQRIGRVDRIGQDHLVQIFNLWVKGTIEERVLNVLERRINIFEETVGGLDPILGDTEKDLRKVLRMADTDRDRALELLEVNLEQQVNGARAAEEKLRDFIMDTKSYSREIAERIAGQRSPVSPEDQKRFIKSLLTDVGTRVSRVGDSEYLLTFHDPFTSDYPEFFKEGRKRRAVFRAEERKDTELVEYFAFGHPIIEQIVERVLDGRYEGCNGSLSISLTDDSTLRPGKGWLFVYVLELPVPQSTSHLVPIFVPDDQEVDLDTGRELVALATRFPRGQVSDIPFDDLDFTKFERARDQAERFASEVARTLERDALAEAESRLELERARLETYFDYRQIAATDRLAATAATLKSLANSVDENVRKIIPVWQSNLERDERLVQELADERARKLAELEKLLEPSVDWQMVGAGRVEIEAVNHAIDAGRGGDAPIVAEAPEDRSTWQNG